MTSEEFDQLVNRIQTRYGSRPRSLRWRTALMVGLGYAGFLALLLIVLVLSAVLVVIALVTGQEPGIFLMAVVAVLLAFGLCQALIFLWVPVEIEPEREITRDESPRLFQLLDTLQAEIGVAPFDHVWVSYEFNASVRIVPRLGVFGFNRSYLSMGLPLMRVVTPTQFSAVLGHEFAHFSSRHDRFGMWIYRLRQTWSRVFAQLRTSQSTGAMKGLRTVIIWFLDWYWPRFNAYAFVLNRADEYEADRVAADCVGAEAAAEALFRIECFSQRLNDKFWTDLKQKATVEPTTPDDIVTRIQTFLDTSPDPADANRWLERAAQTLTGNVDTHPSLSDRLKALEHGVDRLTNDGFPYLPGTDAAAALLGEALPTIADDVNKRWQKDNALRWQNIYHQARRLERQLDQTKPAPETPRADPVMTLAEPFSSAQANSLEAEEAEFDVDHHWQQVKTVFELQSPDAAEPLLRRLLTHRPSHSAANVTLGRLLLERGREEGEQYLRRVIDEDDTDLVTSACEGLIQYYQQMGEPEKVREARLQLSQYEKSQIAAAKERNVVTASDNFVSHDLTDRELAELKTVLSQQSELAAAFLARKDLQHFKKQRLFVLTVHSQKSGLFGSTHADTDRRLVTRLISTVKLPGRVLIIAPQGGFRSLAKKIMSRSDARVFQRDS